MYVGPFCSALSYFNSRLSFQQSDSQAGSILYIHRNLTKLRAMHLRKDELTILYNSQNSRDKNTVVYARTITNKINRQDLNSVDVSATLFRMIFEKFGDVLEVVNKADPYYKENLKGLVLAPKMWFMAMKKRPELLKAPVAFYKDKILVCHTPTDILKMTSAA